MAISKPGSAEEVEWILRCQRGDSQAFEPLVERHQRRVFSLVYHLVRRQDQVEDLVQEVLIKAFVGIRSYNFQSAFGTWLSQITVNHCYDYLRRERVSRVSYYWQISEESARALETAAEEPSPSKPDPEQQVVLRDLAGKLLARAPVADRIVLTLKELEGLSIEEISEIMDVKPSTVKVRLHRARKRMLEDLKQWQKRR